MSTTARPKWWSLRHSAALAKISCTMAHLERHDAYRYLDFNFRAKKNMANGVSFLVAAAKKAMPAMQRRRAFLQFSNPAVKCDMLDILVLSIFSYACEVWDTDESLSSACEVLHR